MIKRVNESKKVVKESLSEDEFNRIYRGLPGAVRDTLDHWWTTTPFDKGYMKGNEARWYFKALVDSGVLDEDDAKYFIDELRSENGGSWEIDESKKVTAEAIEPEESSEITDRVVVMETHRRGYTVSQVVDNTITVGELIDILEGYDEDMKIVTSHDKGYTYGAISPYDFDEKSIDDE